MKSNQNGKGDKQRPTNKKQYDQNFLFIDWGKSIDPTNKKQNRKDTSKETNSEK